MIVYSIFDTTNKDNYKFLISSNNIEDIYSKVKSFLEVEIDYNSFISQHEKRSFGRHVYESDKNFKSLMTIITLKE